jgi:hypothetical protein
MTAQLKEIIIDADRQCSMTSLPRTRDHISANFSSILSRGAIYSPALVLSPVQVRLFYLLLPFGVTGIFSTGIQNKRVSYNPVKIVRGDFIEFPQKSNASSFETI